MDNRFMFRRARKGKTYFRRVVRWLIQDLRFQNDVRRSQRMAVRQEKVEVGKISMQALSFDVNAFKPHVRSCGEISAAAKAVLRKAPNERSEDDLRVLPHLVNRLQCFEKYSNINRIELGRALSYQCFLSDTTLLRQGDPGMGFYLIVSGTVEVAIKEKNPETGEEADRVINEMGKGDSFGELALLDPNNIRTATIRCKTPCEFLNIGRFEFDAVLRRSHEKEFEIKYQALRSHEFFRGWKDSELREAVNSTHTREYPPNVVVLDGEDEHNVEHLYLLIEGTCKIIRRLPVTYGHDGLARLAPPSNLGPTSPPPHHLPLLPLLPHQQTPRLAEKGIGKGRAGAAPASTPQQPRPPDGRYKPRWAIPISEEALARPGHVLVKSQLVYPGELFGKWPRNAIILSDRKVVCLLISKAMVVKHDRGSLGKYPFHRMLCGKEEEVFDVYDREQNWARYKQLVLEQVLHDQRHRDGFAKSKQHCFSYNLHLREG